MSCSAGIELVDVQHRLLDERARDPVPAPGALAVLAGGYSSVSSSLDALDPSERQRRRLQIAEARVLDVEQRLLVRLVAGDERVARAVALAQHAEAAEQLEHVGERLALVAALEVDAQGELGAERGDLAGEPADQRLRAAVMALERRQRQSQQDVVAAGERRPAVLGARAGRPPGRILAGRSR